MLVGPHVGVQELNAVCEDPVTVSVFREGFPFDPPAHELKSFIGVVQPVKELEHCHEVVVVFGVAGNHEAIFDARPTHVVTGWARGDTDFVELEVVALGGFQHGAFPKEFLTVRGDREGLFVGEFLVSLVVFLGEGLGVHQPILDKTCEVFDHGFVVI